MPPLNKHPRSTSSPSPIYGIRPGFTIADFEERYAKPIRIYGTWDASDKLTAQATSPDSGPTVVKSHARVVKLSLNVSGTGSVHIVATTAADNSTVFDSVLTAGSYEFFVGGWSSVDSDNSSYRATQYGPVKPGSTPGAGNPTGDMETINPDPKADSNYVGGTYNPFQFLSLDGYDLQFSSDVTGSVAWDLSCSVVS